jgi:uncharacterized protein involved in outer membrane biogenesis
MARRRRGFLLRFVIGAVLVLFVLVVAAVGAAALLIDPSAFKPRIEAAVERATGRTLALRGPIRLAWRLPPGIVATDLALANPPGFSRPEMARIGTLAARVALLPLLSGRVEIESIELTAPDVLLERDTAGHANWQFVPKSEGAAPAATPAATAGSAQAPRFVVGSVRIRDGRFAWRDAASGRSATLGVPRLDLQPAGPDSVTIAGDLLADGRTLALSGEVGSFARLLDPAATTPWPVQLVLQGEAARLAVRGTIARPLQGAGYALQVDLAATDLAPFAPFLPAPPPKLHDAALSARLTDAGAPLPEVTAMTLHVAGLALGPVAIDRADITAPGLEAPLNAEVRGSVAGQPLAMKATVGALAATLGAGGAKPAPVPVEASGTAGAARFVVKGTLADAARLAGADLAFALRIADFAALRPLAGRELPAWKDVALDGRLAGDLEGRGPLTLRGLALTTPPLQATGELEWRRGSRPGVRGAIAAQRLELEPLLAAFAPPPPAAATPATPAPPSPARRARVFPDTPIDLAPLRTADADLQLAVATLTAAGVTFSDLAGHLVLTDGRLTFDPLALTAPGGRVEGRLAADAASSEVAVALHAPALALQPLAAAFGAPEAAVGTAFIDADLHGHGASPHALAATLSGRLGIATQDAEIENGYLISVLGTVLRAAKVPESALGGAAGRSRVRCLALRVAAKDGKADVTTFLLDAGRVQVQGGGAIELGPEALALRPVVRVGTVRVPVRVGGTLLDPRPTLDSTALGRTALRGLLGERGGGGGETCPAAVAAAQAR